MKVRENRCKVKSNEERPTFGRHFILTASRQKYQELDSEFVEIDCVKYLKVIYYFGKLRSDLEEIEMVNFQILTVCQCRLIGWNRATLTKRLAITYNIFSWSHSRRNWNNVSFCLNSISFSVGGHHDVTQISFYCLTKDGGDLVRTDNNILVAFVFNLHSF